MHDDVYFRLGERLNQHPVKMPLVEAYLKILQEFYTPEQAELGAAMPEGAFPAAELAKRLNRDQEPMTEMLETMADNGLIFVIIGDDGVSKYALTQFVPGVVEFPLMRGMDTPEDRKVARMIKEFFEGEMRDLMEAFFEDPEAVKQTTVSALVIDMNTTPKYNKFPVIKEDCLVLTDMHHPYQDDAFIDECIEIAKRLGINAVYLGGDTFDMNEASAYSDNPPEKLVDVLREWKKTDEKLSVFSRRVFGLGNHEDRIARNRKLSTVDFVRLLVGDEWEVSPYYYAKVHDVWVGHPTSAAIEAHTKIAIAEVSNVVIGHTHHFAMRQSPDGKKLAVQSGCVADPEKLKYGNVNNAGSQKGSL